MGIPGEGGPGPGAEQAAAFAASASGGLPAGEVPPTSIEGPGLGAPEGSVELGTTGTEYLGAMSSAFEGLPDDAFDDPNSTAEFWGIDIDPSGTGDTPLTGQ